MPEVKVNELLTAFLEKKQTWEELLKTMESKGTVKAADILNPSNLSDIFALLEKHDIRVDTLVMNAPTYSGVRKWGRDILDVSTNRNDLIKGMMAMVWGAQILVNCNVPNDTVLALSEAELKKSALLYVRQNTGTDSLKAIDLYEKALKQLDDVKNSISEIGQIIQKATTKVEPA